MNFVQSEIIEDLFDELLTMNVQNGTDIAASEELLHQHQLTEGRLAVSGGQPHLSDLAIDPKSQAALAAVCTAGLDPDVRVSHLLLFVHTHPQLLPHVVQAVSAPPVLGTHALSCLRAVVSLTTGRTAQLQVLQCDPADGHAHQSSLERLGSGVDLHYRLPRAVLRHRAVVPRDLRPEACGVQYHRLVPQHGTQQQLCLPICRKRGIDLVACTGDAAVRGGF